MKLTRDTILDILELVDQAFRIPETDDVFNKYYLKRRSILQFFGTDILGRTLSQKCADLINGYDFKGNVFEIYEEINSPKHPIRNVLITNEIDLAQSHNHTN